MMNYDELIRQALQRQNDRAAGMKMPHDMEQRVMNRLKPRNKFRYWLYTVSIVAVAASILLLLTLYFNNHDVELQEVPVTAQKTELHHPTPSPTEREKAQPKVNEPSPANDRKKVVAQNKEIKHTSIVKKQSAINTKSTSAVSTADQLNDYIARLEAEMEAVDDSVRTAHLERIIAADYRLQQLVNHIVKGEEEQSLGELQKDSTANYINF